MRFSAGLADPALFVPPVRSRSTRRFCAAFLLVTAAWVLAWPVLSLLWLNRYDDAQVAFVEGVYSRKDVAAARAAGRAAQTGRPRLFVVGGSASLVGIDAELMEAKLGLPVVNFAAHAGLGPEYQLWSYPGDEFTDMAWGVACSYDTRFLLESDRKRVLRALYSVPLPDYYEAFRGWRKRMRGRHHHARPIYDCAALSPNGDLRAPLPASAIPQVSGYPFPDVADAEATGSVRHFRRFASWAKANDVRVFYTWPNMARPDVPLPEGGDVPPAALGALLAELGFVVLDTPADVSFPKAWFTDTAYHPDGGCRGLRTEALIRRLRPHLALPTAPQEPAAYYLIARGDHRPDPRNAVANAPGTRVKYLVPQPVDHPDAVTPEGVARLHASGVPVYFDEEPVAGILEPLGWRVEEVSRATATPAQWLGEYDRHLFLLAGHLPPEAAQKLKVGETGAGAVAVGTGPWSYVRRSAAGGRPLKTDLRSLARRPVPQLLISVAGAGREVTVNRRSIATAPEGGLAAVVVDPEMGTVVDAAAFPSRDADTVTWRLRRLVGRSSAAH